MWKILAWGTVIISAYWLWPIYLIVGGIIACAVASPGGGTHKSKPYRPFKSKPYKPFKFKTRKPIVYKAPRYKKPKPRPKGRKLKDGQTQYMKTFGGRKYWTPKSRWKDRTD